MENQNKLTSNMVAKIQAGAKVEPDTTDCSTPLDAILKNKKFDDSRMEEIRRIQEMRRQRTQVTGPQSPPQEVVTVREYKVNKDFFTCLTLCLIELNHPKINKILNTFGFVMKDLDNKIIFPKEKNRQTRKRGK